MTLPGRGQPVAELVATLERMGRKRSPRGAPDRVTITAKSPEALILGRPLPYPPRTPVPPSDPGAFEHWWKLIYYAFGLADPHAIVPLGDPPTASDMRVLRRFVGLTVELTESTLLNEGEAYTVHLDDLTSPEHVTARFTKPEAMRGFATLFRQFYDPQEQASFSRTSRIAHDAAGAAAGASPDSRRETVKSWALAHRRLQRERLDVVVRKKLGAEKIFPYDPLYGDDEPPRTLINTYNYGEYLHWGSQALAIESVAPDPFFRTDHRYRLGDSMVGLAHLYVGYGQLLATLFPASAARV